MKVLMLNGSPRRNGNTSIALGEMEKIFVREGIETETIHLGNKDIRGCIACLSCEQKGKCVFDDLVNEVAPKFEACDGLSGGWKPRLLCVGQCDAGGVSNTPVLQYVF